MKTKITKKELPKTVYPEVPFVMVDSHYTWLVIQDKHDYFRLVDLEDGTMESDEYDSIEDIFDDRSDISIVDSEIIIGK